MTNNTNIRQNHRLLDSTAVDTCPYCGKMGGRQGMRRYHFENCVKNTKTTGELVDVQIKILDRQLHFPSDFRWTFGRGKQTSDHYCSWLDEFQFKNAPGNLRHVNGEVAARKYCTYQLQKKISGTYQSYMEPLAGVGIDALVFGVDPAQTYVNDVDKNCLQVLRENFSQVTSYNFFDEEQRGKLLSVKPDLIFVDYNNYTLRKFLKEYNRATLDVFNAAQKYVLLNDCGIFYLKNYGRMAYENYSQILGKITNREEYFQALVDFYHKQTGWHLTDIELFYWAQAGGNGCSSYLLFSKEPKALTIHENSREEMIKNRILDVTIASGLDAFL
jgi:hypothetical protein